MASLYLSYFKKRTVRDNILCEADDMEDTAEHGL